MMRNIECDRQYGHGVGVCAGIKWCATPFVLNFGYPEHGYETDVYNLTPDDDGEQYVAYNTFDNEPVKVIDPVIADLRVHVMNMDFTQKFLRSDVLPRAKPSNYGFSFDLSDISPTSRFDPSAYNFVHLLIQNTDKQRTCRIAISYMQPSQPKIRLCDIEVIYEITRPGRFKNERDMLISLSAEHWRATVPLYPDCFVRTFLSPEAIFERDSKSAQYLGPVRLDSGRNPETNMYDTFSTIKPIRLGMLMEHSLRDVIPSLAIDDNTFDLD